MPLTITRFIRRWRLQPAPTPLWIRLLYTHATVMLIGILMILVKDYLYHVNLSDTLIACLVSLISLITITWQISHKIARPLDRLETAIQQFQSGDLSVRVPACSIPEIHRLGLSFNHLAASLQGVESRRRELISDLAHELRTPTTVIHGYLELLNQGRVQFSPAIGLPMSQETERIQRLVNHVLELSKLEAGYLPLQLQVLDPVPILDRIVTMLTPECLRANCQLRSPYARMLPPIFADRDRLTQILLNLMNNAIAHSPHGSITLNAWNRDRFLWIAVTDTGTGIAPEHLPHVFDRFWQAHATSVPQRHLGSTGLGLAISKRLVELQGGQIEVESTLGQGSTFRFSLPLSQ